jgi:hypothetical protein
VVQNVKISNPTQKMSTAIVNRWHTPAPSPQTEYVKSLYDILNATIPVYQQTRDASNIYPFSVIFSRAENSLPFVVRRKRWVPEDELERLHWQTRYQDTYGAPVPKDICVIVARLLTPSEVLDLHDGDPSFFLYTERSASPVAVDAAGLEFDEGRWDLQLLPSGKLDPAHHYGEERSTERHMCCGEPHGLTEGCWTASDKVVRPYQLWYDVAPNFWTEDGPLVTPQYITDNIITGTLWKRTDPKLDADIRDKLARIAIRVSQEYARLTEQLDQRAFDPTISIQLSPHDDLRRVVSLVHAFNEPQQPNTRDPSAFDADWRTHLWERVFRVPEALRLFTQETRAFIVDPSTGQRIRLRIFKAGEQIPPEYAAVVFESAGEIARALQSVMDALSDLKLSIDGYQKARSTLGDDLFEAIFGLEYNALAQSARDVAWTQLRAAQIEMNRRIKSNNVALATNLWDVLEPLQLAERAIPEHLTEQTIEQLTQMVLSGQVPSVEPYRTRFLDRNRPAQQIRDVIQNAIDVIENDSSDVSAAELLWSLETLRSQEWKNYMSAVVQALSSIDNQAAAVPILRTLADQGFSQDIIKRLAALIPPKKPAPPLKAAPVVPSPPPQSVGAFSTKHFLFKSNSCPFDATLSALFKVADAPPTQWVRGAKNLVLPAGCDANTFQAALLSDVEYLQSPPGAGPLRTNALRERFKACFPNVFNADNSGDAVDLLRQLLVVYGAEDKTQGFPIRADKENGVIEFPVEFDAVCNFAPDVLFYDLTIISLLDAQMQGIQNLDEVFTPRDFGRFPVRGAELRKNFFGTEYELMSCIAFAGGFHYVSYVRDPATGTWYFFDADGMGTPGQPLQGALPERVTQGTQLMQPKIWIYRKLQPQPQALQPQAPSKPQTQEPFQEWWIKRRDAQGDTFVKDAQGLPEFPLYRRQLTLLLNPGLISSPSEIRHWGLSMLYNSGLRQNDAEMNAFRAAIEPYAMRLGLVKNGTLSSVPTDIWNDARRRNIYLYAIEKLFDLYDLRGQGAEADLKRALDALEAQAPPSPPKQQAPQPQAFKKASRSDVAKGSAAFPLYRKDTQEALDERNAPRIYADVLVQIYLNRQSKDLRDKYTKLYAEPLGLIVDRKDDLVYFKPSELLWNEGDRLQKNAYLFGVEALLDAFEGILPVREDDIRHGIMASAIEDVAADTSGAGGLATMPSQQSFEYAFNAMRGLKQTQDPQESSDWED